VNVAITSARADTLVAVADAVAFALLVVLVLVIVTPGHTHKCDRDDTHDQQPYYPRSFHDNLPLHRRRWTAAVIIAIFAPSLPRKEGMIAQ
jgi:hypothetical protein